MYPDPPQKPRTIRWIAVVIPLFILGACVWLAAKAVTGGPTYPTFVVPGEAAVSLPEAGTYTLFCGRPANVTVSMDSFRPPQMIWSIQDAQGTSLNVQPYSGSLRVNNTTAIGTVDIPAAGEYHFLGTIPEQGNMEYEISFGKGMFKTVATVAACVVIGLISIAFLSVYLLICLIRYLAQASSATRQTV